MSGGLPFWQTHTIDPPAQWENWRDMFQLASIAKENIDKYILLNPLEILKKEELQMEEEPQKEPATRYI